MTIFIKTKDDPEEYSADWIAGYQAAIEDIRNIAEILVNEAPKAYLIAVAEILSWRTTSLS